jgi:thioredoxin 1
MSEAIQKVTDQSFEADVLKSSVPVLVDYWAEWCGPCKMIAPMLDEWAASYSGRLKVAKVNVDENPAAPSRYHVRSIPTLMLFKDGQPVATKVGALSKSQLGAFIEGNL